MDANLKVIQTELIRRGYDLGPSGADGIPGRYTTTAIATFQRLNSLAETGMADEATVAELFGKKKATSIAPASARPWFDLAVTKKGLQEGRDYSAVAKFLKSDGKTLGDPRKLPWCGDFVETCIALTLPHEPLPVNPYLARNWLKFGVECEPQLGAVMVYWRGSKTGTTDGHVAYCAGAGDGVYYNLGGNQSNSVSVSPLKRNRLLGARWPKSVPMPAKAFLPTLKGGKLSTNEA